MDLRPTHQLRKVVSACSETAASLRLRLSDAIFTVADLHGSVYDEMVALIFDDCLLCCLRKTKEVERLEQRLQAATEGLKHELDHLDQLGDDLAALQDQLDLPYSDVQLWDEQLLAEGVRRYRPPCKRYRGCEGAGVLAKRFAMSHPTAMDSGACELCLV